MKFKFLIGIGISLIVLVLIAPSILNYFIGKQISNPHEKPVEVVWTDQNWQPDEWEFWYHADQGSGLELAIPYKWFLALEQPKVTLFGSAPSFLDSEFIRDLGFLPDGKNKYNPDSIPVGFTKTENYIDPLTNEPRTLVGLTCAACHTGQVNYKGKGIRIEGGPNTVDLNKLQKAFGIALFLTDIDPFRFDRFANKVLGEDYTSEKRQELKQQLKSTLAQGLQLQKDQKGLYTATEEGAARTDALARIGNFVFGTELNKENYRVGNAPVNFPHVWSVPWFNWAQYNGSVSQPMARNGGEALGVFAKVNLDSQSPNVFQSTLNIENLRKIEESLAGDSIFTGLTAPKWPENILGTIDTDLAAQGRQLYKQNCQRCHLPAMDSEEFMADKYWAKVGDSEGKYLKMRMANLQEIGTDPNTATNWYQRTVKIGSLADKDYKGFEYNGIVSAGFALKYIGEKAVAQKYAELELTPEEQEAYNGYRPDIPRSPLAYKSRPLNGIWATAPFLHNGSVPNLYEMLLPAEQRSKKFYLGSREFDPQYVGYQKGKVTGGFLLDTTITGNSNSGHEFKK